MRLALLPLYRLLRFFTRLALRLFLGRQYWPAQWQAVLGEPGPLLLLCNHPNSFLDAVILAAHSPRPISFLARGDAFQKPWMARVLRRLHMLPIYRLSEGGRAWLAQNEQSFAAAVAVLKGGGVVGIFVEGICINSHQLQALKKGGARIAQAALEAGVDARCWPLRLQYGHLRGGGKSWALHGASVHTASALFGEGISGPAALESFNQQLRAALEQLPQSQRVQLLDKAWKRILLLPNWPLSWPLKWAVKKATRRTVFYDSVWFASLLLLWPVYLMLVLLAVGFLAGWAWGFAAVLVCLVSALLFRFVR